MRLFFIALRAELVVLGGNDLMKEELLKDPNSASLELTD